MTDPHDTLRKVLEAGPIDGPWYIDRDQRPGMEWNNHIVERAGKAVCFMAHSGRESNECFEATAQLIAACHPAAIRALLAERDALARDAARYRRLREQDWTKRGPCVAAHSSSIKLGHDTLTHERLDAAVDAMQEHPC